MPRLALLLLAPTALFSACDKLPTQASARIPEQALAAQLSTAGPNVSRNVCGPLCGRYAAYMFVINERVLNSTGVDGCLESLDPNSIESVDILTATDAAAAYGKGASSGAIVITLKNGIKAPCAP